MKKALKAIFRSFVPLGAPLFLAALSWAIEMQGGNYRITRDDVNSSGQRLAAGAYLLTGTAGGPTDTQRMAGGSFILQSGLQGVYYYPQTITTVSPAPASQTQIDFTWLAPGANQPALDPLTFTSTAAASYVVKYALNPFATQANFEAAATVTQSLTPRTPGLLETLSVPSLQPNTSYYIAIESWDDAATLGRNASYFSAPASTWTLANVPTPREDLWSFGSSTITLTWQTNNNRPGLSVTYNAQLVLDTTTMAGLQNSQTASATGGTLATSFYGLSQGVDYYFRVNALNGVGVESGWSTPWVSTQIPVGLPQALPYTNITVDSLTGNWAPDGGVPPGWPQPSQPSFQANLSDNSGYNNPFLSTGPVAGPGQVLSYNFTGLTPNTTYYGKVRTYPAGGGNASPPADLGIVMTGVYGANTMISADVFIDSGTFSWVPVAPGLNGSNPFYYRVELSTAADYSGTIVSTTLFHPVPPVPAVTVDVTGLLPNTVYHARLLTLNGMGVPSADPALSFGILTTQPRGPVATGYTAVTTYQIGVSWDPNGNNQLVTTYRVDVSSDVSGNFGFISATVDTGVGATAHTFSTPLQLTADTTYFARVQAIGNGGAPDSAYATYGSTVTMPTAATGMAFTGVTNAGMTLGWSNVNLPNAQNALGNGTIYRAELRDIVNEPAADQTFTPTNLSQAFGSLSPNTTYFYRLYTQSRASWPEAGPLTGSTPTLTNTPGLAGSPFSSVTSNSLRVDWAAGGNPVNTVFRVEVSSDPFFSVMDSFSGPNLLNQNFTSLLANTTYYARVWGVNHAGLDSAAPAIIGSTVTLVNDPLFAGFQVHVTSITILVDAQGNGITTDYRIRDVNAPTQDYITQLNPVDGQHPWPWTTVTGLPVNSLRDFRVSALNRAGSETPPFSASTWTYAETPPAPIANGPGNTPISIPLVLNFGGNPNGPSPAPQTEYAVRAIAVTPDGSPSLSGLYLDSNPGGNVFLLDGSSTTPPATIWRTRAEWNGGVIVSSGLQPGRFYDWVVYARNGDGSGPGVTVPGIPTPAGPFGRGTTRAQPPVISLNGVTGGQSENMILSGGANAGVWTNQQTIPFIARGAFNNYYEFSQSASGNITNLNILGDFFFPAGFPGWNGVNNTGATNRSDDAPGFNPQPGYAGPLAPQYDFGGPLSGFYASQEGRWYLYLVGDSYAPGISPHDPVQTYFAQNRFIIHVDTTPPLAPTVVAYRRPGDTVPLPTSQVGWDRPYFVWNDPDIGAPGAGLTISPTVGYSYAFTTAGTDPLPSTDTARNSASEGFLVGASNTAFQVNPPITVAGVYFFKVMSLDKAGNWSPITIYPYDVVPDTTPPMPFVDFGPSVRVAASSTTVAVSTNGIITVHFTDLMNPNPGNYGAFQLQRIRDNMNATVANNVGFTPAYFPWTSSSTVVLTPVGGLAAGCRYQLTSLAALEDISGNSVSPAIDEQFTTLMDPGQPNVAVNEASANWVSEVSFPPNSWNGGLAGVAVNRDPSNQPLSAPALSGLIAKANRALDTMARGYGRPLAIHEFNLYDPSAVRMGGMFNGPVRLTMRYNDANTNGIVDETEGTGAPVHAAVLSIYWLDEDTGVWVRLPGSTVDAAARTVTAEIRHFSVYGVLGAPKADLSIVHAYPVPYKPSLHSNGIKFNNLSSVATIKVFTVNGDLVRTLHETDGDGIYTWNPVTNESGDDLGSDVYIYIVENDQQKKTGKLMVVR